MTLPPIEEHNKFRVIRADKLELGLKGEAIRALYSGSKDNLVLPSSSYGKTPMTLARALSSTSLKPIIFLSQEDRRQSPTLGEALKYGATLDFRGKSAPGMASSLALEARTFYGDGYNVLNSGINTPEMIDSLARIFRSLFETQPEEVWIASGRGTTAEAIQKAWPDTKLNCVMISAMTSPPVPCAAVAHFPKEKFSEKAKSPPPYDACPYFDSKIWQIALEKAVDSAVILNV